MTDNSIKLLRQNDMEAVIGGYGVLFGGVDLDGETFTEDTDFMLDLVPNKLVFINHSEDTELEVKGKNIVLQGIDKPVGEVIKVTPDEFGLYMELLFQKASQYWAIVESMTKSGRVGLSTGTVGHLARRNNKTITRWPIIETSLTLTPAETRTIDSVSRLKSLAKVNPDLEAILLEADSPEMAQESHSDPATDDATEQATQQPPTKHKEIIMSDQEAVTVDLKGVQSRIDAMEANQSDVIAKLDHITQALEKEKPVNDKAGAVKVVVAEEDKPFDTFGEFLISVKNAATVPSNIDPRLASRKATGLNESVGADGGFLVQTDQAGQLMKRAYDRSILANRVRRTPVGPNANGLTAWAVNETTRATGSRWGGIQSYWLGEGGTKLATKPVFREINLKLRKLIGLCYATDELLADSVALGSIISEGFGDDFAWMVDDAIYNGLGGFQPLGFMASGALVSVAKETGQAADTIVAENIFKMYSRRLGQPGPYVWLINQDIEPQLYGLSLDVGTGGMPLYMPPGGLSAAPFGSLMGKPVLAVEQAATVGSVGDIAFVDLSQYILIDKGATQVDSSIHVQFKTDETAYRFVYRVDGQPIDAAPVTPANSALTQSAFVVLASRD